MYVSIYIYIYIYTHIYIYIYTHIYLNIPPKIDVERVNQEKRLVEFADTSPWRATNGKECDVVWYNLYFVFLHATPLCF